MHNIMEHSPAAGPIITGFRLDTDDERTLHYACDPDLQVKLALGGHNGVGGDGGVTVVLVSLDIDGGPADSVDVQAPYDRVDTETLDRAITAMTLVRDALGRTA